MTNERARARMKRLLLAGAALLLATPALSQGAPPPPSAGPAAGQRPPRDPNADPQASGRTAAEPFRIIGNVYYVGVLGISSYLIRTPAGDILIDGAYDYSVPAIEGNIAKVGGRLGDIKILLNSHAHVDHAGGFAQLKKDTGARLWASVGDKPLLEGGYYPGITSGKFPPVKVDRAFGDGEKVTLGGLTLTAHITPGHTPGCTTWSWPVVENGKTYQIALFCSATMSRNIVVGPDVSWPGILADYQRTFAEAPKIKADILLTPHPEQGGYAAKRTALAAERAKGSTANPFIDPTALATAVKQAEERFEAGKAQQEKALKENGDARKGTPYPDA